MVAVDYELTMDDLIALVRHVERRLPRIRRHTMALRYGVPIVFLMVLFKGTSGALYAILSSIYAFLSSNPTLQDVHDIGVVIGVVNLLVLLVPIALAILWVVLFPQMTRWSIIRWYRPWERRILGKVTLSVTAEGITEVTEFEEHKITWAGVHEITMTGTHVFVDIGGGRGIIVPRRAFEDEQSFRRFVDITEKSSSRSIQPL